MSGADITPDTIGGGFTYVIAYVPLPVITAQDGGRFDQGGFTGSGTSAGVDAYSIDDGSTSAVTGIWYELQYSQDHKNDPWSDGFRAFTMGAATPSIGYENVFVVDSGPSRPLLSPSRTSPTTTTAGIPGSRPGGELHPLLRGLGLRLH